MHNPAALLSSLATTNPHVLSLAKYASLATRIEPELLRELRIKLLPDVHADVEAAFWLSELIEYRSPVAATLHQEVQTLLRQTLATEPQALDDAWQVIEQVHRVRPATIRQEEKFIWLSLSNNIEALKKEFQAVISSLLDPSRHGISAWAIRSLQQLPENILAIEEAKMLALGASFRTEGIPESLLKNIAPEELATWSTWLKPSSLSTVTIAVRILEDNFIEFCPPNQPHSHKLSIPDTFPLTVTLRWKKETGQWHSQSCKIKQNEYIKIKVPDTSVELVTKLGEKYTLAKPNIHDVLQRTRKPKVHLTYDIERDGVTIKKELPVVIGVMSDLSGDAFTETQRELSERKFVTVERENFNSFMQQMNPQLNLSIPSHQALEGDERKISLQFRTMNDFSPEIFIYQTVAHSEQIKAHDCLFKLKQFLEDSPEARELFEKELQALVSSSAYSLNGTFFTEFAEKFEVPMAVLQTTLEQIINNQYSPQANIIELITDAITELEERLNNDIQAILNHPKFLTLESKWRGLYYLVNNVEQNEQLKIRVLNVSKAELYNDFQNNKEIGNGALVRHIYEAEFGTANGEPYTAMIGDYYFSTQAQDVELLEGLAQLCARTFCPFIAAASPTSFDMSNWSELARPRDLAHVQERQKNYAWTAFRENRDARFVTLTLPKVLARLPYTQESATACTISDSFSFNEKVSNNKEEAHNSLSWMNSAYAYGTCIAKSFSETGWGTAIRGVDGGGKVEGLTTYIFPSDDGGILQRCPTEIGIGDRLEAQLSRLGYLPICHHINSDYALFFGAQTLYQAPNYEHSEATNNASISARLPYIFATSRFVQYLKVIARDRIGSFMEAEDTENWLNKWSLNYVNSSENASAEMKAKYPLADCRLQITQQKQNETSEGIYKVQLWLRPWLPMEELTTSLLEEFEIPI